MKGEQNRQRKLQRRAKKAKQRRQKLRREGGRTQLLSGASRDLDDAGELLASGDCEQAVELLEKLDRRYPGRIEILSRLAEAHWQANDLWSYQEICARITEVDPNQPVSWLALGSAALENGQIATACRTFAHIAATWPNHPEAAKARETQESLQSFLAAECRRYGLDDEVGLRVLLLHDEVNRQLNLGQFDKVCGTATRLLATCPAFVPALNNRSQAHFLLARYAEAIADSRRVLELDPTNYHALANLSRYLYLSGQFEEAQTVAAALKTCDAANADAFLKKAEAFAILGDWEAVSQAVHDGQRVWAKLGGTPALAEHLAGVAQANLGDLNRAREHWRRAADAPDAVEWANENLKDSERPIGKRHGPWAYPLFQWLPRSAIEELVEFGPGKHRDDDVTRFVQGYLEKYPQLELLADAMLQRSDASACELLIRMASLVKRPAIIAAIKKFALGKRGTDEQRMKALQMLSREGYVDSEVELYREGSLHPIRLTSQEIHWEPTSELPPEIQDLARSAHAAICDGRGADAERQYDEILRLRPDDTSAQYNRAVAIGLQGREAEALQIVRQIHQNKPDYIFARTHLADHRIAHGDLEEAKALLAPILQKPRLHASEYFAWCSSNINLALAAGDSKMAKNILAGWKRLAPDDHRIRIWQSRIRDGRGLLDRLERLFSRKPDDAK